MGEEWLGGLRCRGGEVQGARMHVCMQPPQHAHVHCCMHALVGCASWDDDDDVGGAAYAYMRARISMHISLMGLPKEEAGGRESICVRVVGEGRKRA